MSSVAKNDLLAWGVALALALLAAAFYLADSSVQVFERRLPNDNMLSSLLRPLFADAPLFVRHHFADFAWSLLAAMVVRYCWPMQHRLGQLAVLVMVATSWEWLQLPGLVPGHFDVIDISAGLVAALLVWWLRPVRETSSEPGDSM